MKANILKKLLVFSFTSRKRNEEQKKKKKPPFSTMRSFTLVPSQRGAAHVKVNGRKCSEVSSQGEHWTVTPVISERLYKVLDHQRPHHSDNKEGMQQKTISCAYALPE